MLCVVTEDTERVIGERRMATLRDLGLRPQRCAHRGRDAGVRRPGSSDRNRRDLPFTLTYLFSNDGAVARLAGRTGIGAGHPAAPAELAVKDPDAVWPAAALLRGESTLVDLDSTRFPALPAGDWSEPPVRALIVPLAQQGGAPPGSWW